MSDVRSSVKLLVPAPKPEGNRTRVQLWLTSVLFQEPLWLEGERVMVVFRVMGHLPTNN